MTDNTYSVGQLLDRVNAVLSRGFPDEVWVAGEITGWSEWYGWRFFDLVEHSPESQQGKEKLSVVLQSEDRYRIETRVSDDFALKDGLGVRIKGNVSVYKSKSSIQIVMTDIDPIFTIGRLALKKKRVLATLKKEGLMERNKAKPMPVLPLRIGLITSYGSAAYHDIIKQLSKSTYGWQVTPINSSVQGARAEESIVYAFSRVCQADVDVVILARGGGSATDLAVFDTVGVARAVAGCKVPVLTGIGHEIDHTVADDVAYFANATPTASAQWLVDQVDLFAGESIELWKKLYRLTTQRIAQEKRLLNEAGYRIRGVSHQLGSDRDFLKEVPDRLEVSATRLIGNATKGLRAGQSSFEAVASKAVSAESNNLAELEVRLRTLDPVRILARGWSITRRADGIAIRSARDVGKGDVLITQLANGLVQSSVTDVEERDDNF